jgi:hypothetical protein
MLLERDGHEDHRDALIMIEKFCYYYQMKSPKPRCFKFIFRDDCKFNYKIFVDVLYLIFLPALQIVDVKGSRCRRLKVCELNAVYSKAEEEEEGNLEYMLTASLI